MHLMSLGKFHEMRVKKQLLFERAQEKKRLHPEASEESGDEDFKPQKLSDSTKGLKAVDAFGTGFLGSKYIEPRDDLVEEFGNLSLGVKPANHLISCTRDRQNEMKNFYANDKENMKRYYGSQKQVEKLIKEQVQKDNVKEFTY